MNGIKVLLRTILWSVVVLLVFGGTSYAALQTIENGSTEGAIRATVRDNGMVGIYRLASDNVTWVEQIYGGDNKYFMLFLAGDNTAMRYTSTDAASEWDPFDPYLTPVSNTTAANNNSIITVMDAGTTGVRWTQTVTKTGGAYVIYRWEIANTGSSTFTDLRAIDGEDTYFAGNDNGNGFWNPSQRMVYVRNSSGGANGLMGFYTSAAYAPDMYHEGQYGTNYDIMATGTLDNVVEPSLVDSGYSLGWKRASLAPGETWVIEAFEKFITSGDVQVIAPSEQTVDPGTNATYIFEVSNFGVGTRTLNLTATSQNSWTTQTQDSGGTPISSITIPGGGSDNVTVIVSVPAGAAPGSTDLLTLTATDNTTPTVTGQDSTTTRVTGQGSDTVILFSKNTPSVGCGNIVVGRATTPGKSIPMAGLFLMPAFVLLGGRWLRKRGKRNRNASPSTHLLLLFAASLFALGASTAQAGPLGPPKPSVAAGKFGAAIGYFYTADKWEPDQSSTVSGGTTVVWDTDKVKQNSIFLRGMYGFSGNCEASIKVGIANRAAPQGFEDSYAFLAGLGAKGVLFGTSSFSVGPIVDFTWYSNYEDDISFSQGGATWSGTEKIEDSWDLHLAIGLQADVGKGIVYGGPSFYWSRADVSYRISNGVISLNVDNEYNQKDSFGGFAGVRFPVTDRLGVEVEGQYRNEFSGGATILYSF